ncbi:hypothetical protein CC78DRAFT_388395 [Lojkania enalia]|uniref:Uncharacterized protein n=1 Tax=Lojkania enalia TaxID=147567 RepID=A0A9P4K207_9PLEO|nr:hypothetical protein CC78DRAFT_388395 [Didymosphaeria enalia]
MEQAPPYSPTASSSERRLPADYPSPWDELATLTRPKATTTPPRHIPRIDASNLLEAQHNALAHASTAPLPFEPPPPGYTPLDALAQSFRLVGSLIFTTKTSNMPRYQLMQEFSRSGRPRQLHIRRLMGSETRRHSLSSSPLYPPQDIEFDRDGTMYSISNTSEMRGHRSSTLGGIVKLESGVSLIGGRWTRIWHLTKNARRDSLNPENDARLRKYGYHADDEWDKRLLFCVKRGRWEDDKGRYVAVEVDGEKGGRDGWGKGFEIVVEMSAPRKDLLVSCWVMKVWTGEGLRWEGDVRDWRDQYQV